MLLKRLAFLLLFYTLIKTNLITKRMLIASLISLLGQKGLSCLRTTVVYTMQQSHMKCK